MISAGITEVKNNLSRLFIKVKAGEEILITDRGRPVARIVKETQGDKSIRAVLGPLVQKGLIVLPSRSILKDRISALEAPGKHVSEMVIEDRR
ncbi:MAG: type II toxin-antitoxin system prevent-host-death family antitoxin [Deltaproteobacteria bacterium]|nr:type II toxin-antitoxin system prevent-host-death family antitoxin [Deltaproteobacteria bacterium]